MTKTVLSCRADQTLHVAAQIMWDRDCGCVPVVDAGGHVLGMLTDRDICMAAHTRGAPLSSITAGSVMSKQVHACDPRDSVEVAEKRLQTHQIRRVPVVNSDGLLVGILSLSDLARGTKELGAIKSTLAAITRPRSQGEQNGKQ